MAGLDPAASRSRSARSTSLSYTLVKLATQRRIELRSTAGQAGALPLSYWAVVSVGRLELPLDALSTHCLCRWATRTLVDHRGFEPRTSGLRGPRSDR